MLTSDLLTASRTYTTTVGLPLPSSRSPEGINSTTTPRLTCPDGREIEVASATCTPLLAPCLARWKALRTSRANSRLSLG
ncbi:hypothetical protein D3C76_1514630 [compost metagenome]